MCNSHKIDDIYVGAGGGPETSIPVGVALYNLCLMCAMCHVHVFSEGSPAWPIKACKSVTKCPLAGLVSIFHVRLGKLDWDFKFQGVTLH